MRLGASMRSFLRNVFFSTRQEVELDAEVRVISSEFILYPV